MDTDNIAIDTTIYMNTQCNWTVKTTKISEIQKLLNDGYELEVTSPDGWVGVNFFIDKGFYQEYEFLIDNELKVKCNKDHLFESTTGWLSASDILRMQNMTQKELHFLTEAGFYQKGFIRLTDKTIPIVDINVDHQNHRYYTNGISSHNTGVGKSLFMCHVASSFLTQGKNVLYITLEMSEERIAERIDANLMNVPIDQLVNMPKDLYESKINKIAVKTKGTLIVKEYPTAAAHAGHFRALLNELKLKKDFTADAIFIDYLNICASARMKGVGGSVNTYSFIKAIAEEIRGLAVEFNVPIFSATQTTRSGFNSSDVELTDTSESFGLPATADLMFALISTEELEKMGQLIVKQLKNRYNDLTQNKRFIIGVDRAKMRLYDVENKAQTLTKEPAIRQINTAHSLNGMASKRDFSGFKT